MFSSSKSGCKGTTFRPMHQISGLNLIKIKENNKYNKYPVVRPAANRYLLYLFFPNETRNHMVRMMLCSSAMRRMLRMA